MHTIKLALDWTPNINHIGFFIAREKGFYKNAGLGVELLDPAANNYAVTPAKKVELGEADFALCPTESLISYQTKTNPIPLQAVATIYKTDVSAITCLAESGIRRPAELDGKIYASYQARYEDAIVKQLIKNDGGIGDLQVVYPEKLGIWNTIVNKKFDSTWIFYNWEGVQARQAGIDLQLFKLDDFDVPYGYSPVIAGNANNFSTHDSHYKAFLAATKQGFIHAIEHPEDSVNILKPFIPEQDQNIDLAEALQISAEHFGTVENWGLMNADCMKQFLDWIYEKGMETKELKAENLFTNSLL